MRLLTVTSFRKQMGIGLIELMISMLIGLFIMAGVVQMFSTSSQNAVANAGISRIQENLRYSFSRIAEDIGQTGNLGCINANLQNSGVFQHIFITNLLGLQSNNGQFYDFTQTVNGDESADGSTFPTGEVKTGSDTLRIRYVNHLVRLEVIDQVPGASLTVDSSGSSAAAFAALNQNQVVVATDCTEGLVFMITNDPAGSAGVLEYATGGGPNQHNVALTEDLFQNVGTESQDSEIYLYAGTTGVYQYFIGTSVAASGNGNSCSNTEPQFCSLYRRDGGTSDELAEGVHDMQIEYGWTDASGNLRFANATGVNTADTWNLIDRVRVTFGFNSIEGAQGAGNLAATGNTLDTVFTKTLSRTFHLANQL